MKKWNPLIFCLLTSLWSYGQNITPEVIGSSGGRAIGTNLVIDWTLGEVATTTLNGSNNTITQGFHQPYLLLNSLKELQKPLIEIIVFPNPTSKQINVKSKEILADGFYLVLSSIDGRLLKEVQIQSQENQWLFDLEKFATGNYLLTLFSPSKESQQVYKIQKTQ